MNNNALIIGLGNDIICDDRIGLDLSKKIAEQFSLTLSDEHAINIGVLGEIAGYEKLIIVDSIKTGNDSVGTVKLLTLEDIENYTGAYSTHQISLSDLFKVGEKMDFDMPKELYIISVEIKDNETITEDYSPEIESLYDSVLSEILDIMNQRVLSQ